MFTNLLSIVYLLSTAVEMKDFFIPPQQDMNVNKFFWQWECHLKMLQPFSGIILLLTHVHACMCDITAVCVHAAGGSGVKWISCRCWNRRVAAAPTSAGDVLLHVVRVTPCLCGFNSSLRSVSGFCIWLCGCQRNFSREWFLRRSHKKASPFDAKL